MGATMAVAMAGQAVVGMGQAYAQSQALSAKGDYEKRIADINASYSEVAANDALKRGDVEANQRMKQNRALVGAQRAAFAASGVDPNSGSAADVSAGTRTIGDFDALTIKNNAWREAWGYKVQGANYQAQGNFAQMSGNNAARDTLLTGGMNAVSTGINAWGAYDKYKKGKT